MNVIDYKVVNWKL